MEKEEGEEKSRARAHTHAHGALSPASACFSRARSEMRRLLLTAARRAMPAEGTTVAALSGRGEVSPMRASARARERESERRDRAASAADSFFRLSSSLFSLTSPARPTQALLPPYYALAGRASPTPPRLLVFGGRGGDNYTTSAPLPMDEVWELPLLPGGGGAWRLAGGSARGGTRGAKKRGHRAPSPRFLFAFDSFTHANRSYGVVMGGDGGPAGGGLLQDAWRYGATEGVWERLG